MQRACEDTLSRAFKRLDPEDKGYLMPDDLRNFLTNQGEIFSQEEIDEMIIACTGYFLT
jgi:Ca2+-binding EF-hand superfamily protein